MAFEYVQLEEDIATTLFANYYYSSPEFEELVLRPPSPAERLRQLHERILSSTTASNDDIKYWTKLYEGKFHHCSLSLQILLIPLTSHE